MGAAHRTKEKGAEEKAKTPRPAGSIEIEGRSMVVVPVEEWEEIVEKLEDYHDLVEAREALEDPRARFVSLEEARKELFGNRIKKVRSRKKITQKELAKRLRVSQARVSQMEDPDYRPKMEVYEKVAKALGCDVEELI